MRNKGYILVEGQGETLAAHNLITRLSRELSLSHPLYWAPPRRWTNLHQWEAARQGGLAAGAELIRRKPDAGALLILRDEDDGCPKEIAPAMSARLTTLELPFPTAYVLLRPEYEVLFLPCLDRMSGLGFAKGLRWDRGGWEAKRGIKEWLSGQLPRGRAYKPTTMQLAMTQRIELQTLRTAEVPCFGSLERGITFLAQHSGIASVCYPPK